MKKIIVLLVMVLPFMMMAQEAPVKAVAGETIKVPCERIDSVIAFSKTKLGCKYKYAASGPDVFDCSGFVMFVYGHFGVQLPHGSSSQYLLGRKVKRQDIRPGDLLFFNRSKGIGHAAMVTNVDSMGRVTFIHASTYRTGVKYDRLESEHYANTFVGARRILECIDDSTYQLAYSDEEVAAVERAAVTVQPATDSYYYHRVKRGETLSSIARKYGTNVVSIKNWNNLRSDNIREGQALKIYRKSPTPASKPAVTAEAQDVQTPVKMETEPVTVETKPVTVETEPITVETKPVTVETEPITVETEPITVETKPITVETKPITVETKPITVETKPATAEAEPEWIYHTIAKGEGLYGIARKYGTTVDNILQWNNLSNPDKIAAGQKLKIRNSKATTVPAKPAETGQPVPAPAAASAIYHTVQKGESLGRIAEKYHTTVQKIMQWNNISNPDKIAEGQKLKILQ
jgi:LysM repeat protein